MAIRFSKLCHHLLLVLFVSSTGYCGEKTVEIQGQYSSWAFKGIRSHGESPPASDYQKTLDVNFVAKLSGDSWGIWATNANDPSDWEQIIYDGTNSYTSIPTAHINLKNEDAKEVHFGSSPTYTIVSSSPIYGMLINDRLKIYVPWLTYCLDPSYVKSNSRAGREIPLPWMMPRSQLLPYGYRWDIVTSKNGRFMEKCDAIRDVSLDLSEDQEFLRPGFVYPRSWDMYVVRKNQLKDRLAIANGFVDMSYSCTNWYDADSLIIPQSSEVKRKFFAVYDGKPSPFLIFRTELKMNSVTVNDSTQNIIPQADDTTYVQDYRYRIIQSHKIYRYAEYTLSSGEVWKSDTDSILLKNRDDYLKHVSRYDDFGMSSPLGQLFRLSQKTKTILTWFLLALITMPIIFMFWKTSRKQNDKQN